MTLVTPSTADVMRGVAYEIRRDPSTWTQGALWKDANGWECPPDLAVCGCAAGLLEISLGITATWMSALPTMERIVGMEVPVWNDTPGRTSGEVADLFDAAADILDQREAA